MAVHRMWAWHLTSGICHLPVSDRSVLFIGNAATQLFEIIIQYIVWSQGLQANSPLDDVSQKCCMCPSSVGSQHLRVGCAPALEVILPLPQSQYQYARPDFDVTFSYERYLAVDVCNLVQNPLGMAATSSFSPVSCQLLLGLA